MTVDIVLIINEEQCRKAGIDSNVINHIKAETLFGQVYRLNKIGSELKIAQACYEYIQRKKYREILSLKFNKYLANCIVKCTIVNDHTKYENRIATNGIFRLTCTGHDRYNPNPGIWRRVIHKPYIPNIS